LKLRIAHFALIFSLCLITLSAAFAAAPTLEPIAHATPPGEVRPGDPQEFSMLYRGDPPTALTMVVLTPGGETVRVPAKATSGDPASGVPVTWPFTPSESGQYRYHFEAAAGDIGSVRYPATPTDDPQFVVVNLYTKYIILVTGLLIALLFLPFVVYVAARSANRRGDPGAAARVALLIGVAASYALFLYLFYTVYSALLLALAGVVALGLLIILFTRRVA